MKFDKEATKLNAINMLAMLASGETFISPTEEMIYIAKKSSETSEIINLVNSRFMELDIYDQLIVGRMTLVTGEIMAELAKKYGFMEEENDQT